MQLTPEKQEIDHRTIKLLVGIIALSLPILTNFFAPGLTSISASYFASGFFHWSQSIFIGFLFAIAAFLCAYNGLSSAEMILSKVASLSALGLSLFPCRCDGHPEIVPYVHYASAATMFLILAFFCWKFWQRAIAKGHSEARLRATIYVACGLAMLVSIAVLGLNAIMRDYFVNIYPRFVFYGEATGLMAFGVAWLTASRTLPVLTRRTERFSPFRASNPS